MLSDQVEPRGEEKFVEIFGKSTIKTDLLFGEVNGEGCPSRI